MTRYLPRIGLVVLFLALCLILQRNTPLVRPSTEISGEVSKPVFRGAPPVEERADLVLLTEDIRRERQDVRWERPIPEAAFGDFREWARVYSTAPEESLRSKGRALAEARRRDLSDLIQTDPRRALELAVPRAVRRTLPPDIVALLEEPISGTGDLLVVAAVPMPGRERWVDPVQRFVQMKDGREFAAFTFGRRESVPSRNGIGVHGIALDGKLALADLPGRIMEPVEVAEARENETTATICPTSGLPSETDGDEVVVDWDGDMHSFYCSPKHAEDELLAAAEREDAFPLPIAASGGDAGGGADGDPPIAYSGYTEGTKKMLIIRVDFPDKQGQVVSNTTLTNLINDMASHWNEMSFDKMTWALAGSGSDFTPTLRLPNNHSNYTGFSTMLNAARAAAEDAGYDYRDYNFEVVVTGDKPDVGFGGVAYVGGRGAWLANAQWNLGVCSHEVGHNFGLNHAGFWDIDSGSSPIGSGNAVEYGNPYDHMGGASSATRAHFGARQKNYLDWIPDGNVKKIGSNGTTTTRMYAFDQKAATGTRAIAIDRSGTTSDYWLEYRQAYASSNKWLKDGIVINWGPYSISNGKPLLLDMAANTSTKDDVSLLIGRTFADTDKGIYITPVARGTESGISYVDVTVNRGTFASNEKPTVAVTAGNLNPAVNGSVTYTATASDPDGDTVGYYWDWGDGTFTANNSATASHSFSSSGTKTVRCIVTDMKGATATGQLLVQVGSSSTFFVQGLVRDSENAPLSGVKVTADASHSDTTDSEGYYAITGLSAGSYTISASKTGFSFEAVGFSNPVSVGPSKQNVNFFAPPGVPNFGSIKPGLVDSGSNTGSVFLSLTDPDTPLTDLTLSGTSSNTAIVPNANITFSTIGSLRTVKVAAPSNTSGQIDVTITATDPLGATASYVWPVTVNGKPTLTASSQTTGESTPLDIDLRGLATDDLTPADDLRFEATQVLNGSVALLDGHTARFTPMAGYNGSASFQLSVRDQSLSSRTLLLWDFEQPDTTADGKIADRSNFARNASFETAGSGGEYAYGTDVPPALAPYSRQSLSMVEGGAGAVRARKTLSSSDVNFNNADWSFCAWVKRNAADSDDFVWHLGEGGGYESKEELSIFFPAGSDLLQVSKNGTSGQQALLSAADVSSGEWHHICLTYDRTGTNTGILAIYVDGFLGDTATGVQMGIDQSFSTYLGGTGDDTANLDRWFDGKFDDVMLVNALLSRKEIYLLATMGAQHQLGLTETATVTINIAGTNQQPSIAPVPDIGLDPGVSSSPILVSVSDSDSESRTLTLTATTSNPTLLPASGISVSGPPAAWSSGDRGTVGAAGSMTEDHGTFVIQGAGAGIGGTSDNFHWARQDVSGDVDFSARIVSLDYTHQEAKAGVMLRDSSDANAPFAFAAVTAGQGVTFEYRDAAGGVSVVQETIDRVAAPCWVRIVRSGDSFTAFYALDDGLDTEPLWLPLGSPQTLSFPTEVYRAGMAVTSKVNATLSTAVIDRLGGNLPRGGERFLTLTPAPGQTGIASVVLQVTDGTLANTTTFDAIIGINTPPTISAVEDIQAAEGEELEPFTFSIGDLHTTSDALLVSVTSSDPWLLPADRIELSGTGSSRTLSIRPVASETGTVTVSISVDDGETTTVRSFTVTIDPGDPSLFVRSGANWRFLDSGASPDGWQTVGYDDTAWPFGPAQIGFGDGDEETQTVADSTRTTTYFRRSFEVGNHFDYEQLRFQLLRDDGAVIYLNGIEIARSNMPEGVLTSSTFAAASVSGSNESTYFPIVVNRPPLLTGTNVLAVEVHQINLTSSDLSFDLELRGANPEPLKPVAAGSVWQFLDDGTEAPADWMTSAFAVPASWKSGPAQLGYGDNDESTVVESGPSSDRFTTTYFRRYFDVEDPSAISQAFVRFQRDDGIVVYLNGAEIARDNMPDGTVTYLTRATKAIGGADESAWQSHTVDPGRLLAGANVIAVEIHQASATSSDISFDLETLLYTNETLPVLGCICSDETVTLSWSKWASGWQLQESADLLIWDDVLITPADSDSGISLTLPRSPGGAYYRIVAP